MFVLDTDILSLLLRAHVRMTERVAQATDEVAGGWACHPGPSQAAFTNLGP